MKHVLVTGANGFVGKRLCRALADNGYHVTGTVRTFVGAPKPRSYELQAIGDIGAETDWGAVLRDVDLIVHLAARVHVMQDRELDPLAAFRRVNVHGTEQLLAHEYMQKVKRIVYISTVKVHGDVTGDTPFAPSDVLAPTDPYALSKLEAEQLVESVGVRSGFETVIIRPPLVYGPGVGGNFLKLLRVVDKGYPLPFGSICNLRSMVGVDNLCDLIRECLGNQSAPGRKFLVSDNSDVSTPDLVRLIARSMSTTARLVPISPSLLHAAARLFGRTAEISRLTSSLQVRVDETMRDLEWVPPDSLMSGIQATVASYTKQKIHALV